LFFGGPIILRFIEAWHPGDVLGACRVQSFKKAASNLGIVGSGDAPIQAERMNRLREFHPVCAAVIKIIDGQHKNGLAKPYAQYFSQEVTKR